VCIHTYIHTYIGARLSASCYDWHSNSQRLLRNALGLRRGNGGSVLQHLSRELHRPLQGTLPYPNDVHYDAGPSQRTANGNDLSKTLRTGQTCTLHPHTQEHASTPPAPTLVQGEPVCACSCLGSWYSSSSSDIRLPFSSCGTVSFSPSPSIPCRPLAHPHSSFFRAYSLELGRPHNCCSLSA